jgi:hypothetical protein
MDPSKPTLPPRIPAIDFSPAWQPLARGERHGTHERQEQTP